MRTTALLQHKSFLIAALAASSFAFTACGDDPTNPGVDCEVTPNDPSCKDPNVDCDETPNDPSCTPPVNCDETPDADECQPVDCDVDAKVREVIDAKDSAATLPSIVVDTLDEDHRTLTFDAGLGGPPAAAASSWLYLDVETNSFLDISDEESLTNTVWDFAFKRTEIRMNSGNSGPGGLMLGKLTGVTDITEIAQPTPNDVPFKTEVFIDDETCEVLTFGEAPGPQLTQTAVGQWYVYDYVNHGFTPEEGVAYAIYNRADGHHVYKMQVQAYDNGTYSLLIGEFVGETPVGPDCEANPTAEGCPEDPCIEDPEAEGCEPVACDVDALVDEALAPQSTPANAPVIQVTQDGAETLLTVDARLGGAANAPSSSWVYVDLEGGEILPLSDEDAFNNSTWDIALKRSDIRLNSGNSGPQGLMLGKKVLGGTSFADWAQPARNEVTFVTESFVDEDACEILTYGRGSVKTAFAQWYEYDMSTHTLAPEEDVAYAVYTGFAGNHRIYKLQIRDYQDGIYTFAVREF